MMASVTKRARVTCGGTVIEDMSAGRDGDERWSLLPIFAVVRKTQHPSSAEDFRVDDKEPAEDRPLSIARGICACALSGLRRVR